MAYDEVRAEDEHHSGEYPERLFLVTGVTGDGARLRHEGHKAVCLCPSSLGEGIAGSY